jgi:cysteine desulfurase family protein
MAYFDNAATTFPKPECVYDYMNQYYRNNGGSYGRGESSFAMSAKGLIEQTRQAVQKLLHCPAKQIVFQPSATISLNVVIQGVIAGGAKNIYISPFEHNAVTRVLHHYESTEQIKVNVLSVTKQFSYDMERIKFQFEDVAPDFVILSHASNVIGLIAPVAEIFTLAKQYKAVTLLDMAQTAGLVDIDVGQDTIDFAVFAGHKTMYGPTGISGFVMKPDFKLAPTLFGGTGFDSANQEMPKELPERFEIGTMNAQGAAGLLAALKWIENQGISSLFQKEQVQRNMLLNLLKSYSFVKIVGDCADAKYVGIVSCVIDGISSDIAGQLFSEREVAVRTGLHCAPLAHKFLGTFPSGTIRFSVSNFTSDEDFEVLRNALDDISDNLW